MRVGSVNIAGRVRPVRAESDLGFLRRVRDAVANQAAADADRVFLWLPVATGVGIAVYFSLAVEPPGWFAAGLVFLSLSALLMLRRNMTVRRPLFFILAGCVGFAAAQIRTVSVDGPRLDRGLGPTRVVGRVIETERVENGLRVVLEALSIDGLAAAETPRRVRIRLLRRDIAPAAGDAIGLRAVVTPLPEPTMPGAFDFQRHAFFQRLGGLGYAVGPSAVLPGTDGDGPAWSSHIERWRQQLDDHLRRGFGGDDAWQGTIASALITGKRADVPEDVLNAMRDAGLAHLLAISGLNFALAAGLIYLLVRGGLALVPPLALRLPIKKIAAIAALVAAFFYLLLSGATIPTQRSFVMMSLALLAVLLDRLAISMRPVALAAAAILLLMPEALIGASFQLSFAAVIALVAAYEAIRDRPRGITAEPKWWRRPALYVGGVLLTTIVATLGTAPFSIYHFNQLTTYGALANLIAVPVTSFWVMPVGLLAMAAMPFGLEGLPLAIMGAGIELIVGVAKTIAGWPGAIVHIPALPQWGLGLMTIGGLWLTLWRRRWRLLGLPAIAVGFFVDRHGVVAGYSRHRKRPARRHPQRCESALSVDGAVGAVRPRSVAAADGSAGDRRMAGARR